MSSTTPSQNSGRRTSATPTTPSSSGTSNVASSPARTSTLKSKNGAPPSARAAAKRTTAKETETKGDEDAKAETAALIEDLKEQLRKTESASEEFQKQLLVAQSRLDEALSEQSKLEETTNQHIETVSSLESQLREASRQKTDLETQREANELAWTAEREATTVRESELQAIIQRLKENLAQRDPRRSVDGEGGLSRTGSTRGRSSPNPEAASLSPPPLARRDSSQSGSQLILQKDRVIEELRLELAEAHIKVMEVDRAGGGRLQELEKKLLEARMANAKLMEDNESYQFLLQERTLNGDFASRFRATTPSEKSNVSREQENSSLAEELETASEAADLEDAKERRTLEKAEKEIISLEDQNKAMKLYIDKIIGKLLASDHYEAVLGGPAVAGSNAANAASSASGERRVSTTAEDEAGKENTGPSLLQRAGSIFGARARPRPSSQIAGQTQASSGSESQEIPPEQRTLPTANENPTTAPSVPLRRGESSRNPAAANSRSHRRSNSDWSTAPSSYTTRTPSIGNRPVTPNQTYTRQSSLSQSSPQAADSVILEDDDGTASAGTAAPASDADGVMRSTSRAASDSGYGESIDALSVPSPPRSVGASSNEGGRSASGSGAMVSGKQMRPLRLVQEKEEAEAEKKRQSRGSWVGWFNRGGVASAISGAGAGAGTTAPPQGSQSEARPPSG